MIVRVTVPVGVDEVVATVRAEVVELFAAGVTEVGFMVQVVFAGHPVTLTPTALLKLLVDVTVMVDPPLLPCVKVSDVGLLEIEKSGVGATPQAVNLNEPMPVLQLKLPFEA